mgnify:CR=1 FL=1
MNDVIAIILQIMTKEVSQLVHENWKIWTVISVDFYNFIINSLMPGWCTTRKLLMWWNRRCDFLDSAPNFVLSIALILYFLYDALYLKLLLYWCYSTKCKRRSSWSVMLLFATWRRQISLRYYGGSYISPIEVCMSSRKNKIDPDHLYPI